MCYLSAVFHIAGYLLLYASACVNPIIYVIMNAQYRAAYAAALCCPLARFSGLTSGAYPSSPVACQTVKKSERTSAHATYIRPWRYHSWCNSLPGYGEASGSGHFIQTFLCKWYKSPLLFLKALCSIKLILLKTQCLMLHCIFVNKIGSVNEICTYSAACCVISSFHFFCMFRSLHVYI